MLPCHSLFSFNFQGHEVIKWDERKEEEKKKVMFIQYGLLAGTSLYLPISRSLAEIIRCGPRMIRVSDRTERSAIDYNIDRQGNLELLRYLLKIGFWK